ncbi:unnamed protein product, partial [Tilletia controversa]
MLELYGREWFYAISVHDVERAQHSFPRQADMDFDSIQWLSTAVDAETSFTPSELVPPKINIQYLYEQSKQERDRGHVAVSFVLETQPRRVCVWSLDKIRIGNEYASFTQRIDEARHFLSLLREHSDGHLADIFEEVRAHQMFSLRGDLWSGISYSDLHVLRRNEELSDTVIDFYLCQVRSLDLPNAVMLPSGFNMELAREQSPWTWTFGIKELELWLLVRTEANLEGQERTKRYQDADFSLAFVIESSVCCQADGRFPSSRSSTPDYKDSVFSDAVNGTYDGAEDSSASSMASSLASERDSDSDSGHDPAATVSDLLSRRFSNLEDAIASCCEAALQEGFVLHRDSSQLGDVEGESITVWKRLRCKMYNIAVHKSKRSKVVDPANMRNTTPAPPRCSAMLNLRLIDKGPNWRISKLDWKHNHDSDPVVDFDDEAERKPSQPTQAEKDLIRGLVVGGMGKLNRSQALQVV